MLYLMLYEETFLQEIRVLSFTSADMFCRLRSSPTYPRSLRLGNRWGLPVKSPRKLKTPMTISRTAKGACTDFNYQPEK